MILYHIPPILVLLKSGKKIKLKKYSWNSNQNSCLPLLSHRKVTEEKNY